MSMIIDLMKAYGIKEISEDGVCYGIAHNLAHEKINNRELTWLAMHSKMTALTPFQLFLLTKPEKENLLTKFHEPDSFTSVTELYKKKALVLQQGLVEGGTEAPAIPTLDFPFTRQEWEMIPAFLENIQLFHSNSIDHAFTGKQKSLDKQNSRRHTVYLMKQFAAAKFYTILDPQNRYQLN